MTQDEIIEMAMEAEFVLHSKPSEEESELFVCVDKDIVRFAHLVAAKEREALAQTQELVAVYGYCPECGAKGVMRERRPNGNDKCANGHTYPSNTAAPPQRTWVGLTDEERIQIDHLALSRVQAVQMTEAKLKEKNT
jgi:hypothetical protein